MQLIQATGFRGVATGLALSLLSACTTSAETPDTQRQTQRLEPTGQLVAFHPALYSDFDDYVNQTQHHLLAHKVYMDPDNAKEELEIAMPFSLQPDQVTQNVQCATSNKPTRGVVLLHGLSDMPAAMRDLATAFTNRCFVAYSMLLPGHGARPAELLDVSREDWLAVARFGVDTLKTKVDEVYVGGFSLGGLVAIQTAIDDPDIAGVFAFSPAIALHRSFLLDQTIWLRHFIDWLDTDPPDDAWRFESVPFNALAETQLMARSVRAQLKRTPLETPVFVAQSPDDAVVNAKNNQWIFERSMTHGMSRLLTYEGDGVTPVSNNRILRYPSVLPELRILGYAHQSVHIAPHNKHYGVNGEYRNCHINIGNKDSEAVDRCRLTESPFRGEVFGSAVHRYDKGIVDTLARLTFNPQFSTLMDEIDRFLDSLSPKSLVVHNVLTNKRKRDTGINNFDPGSS